MTEAENSLENEEFEGEETLDDHSLFDEDKREHPHATIKFTKLHITIFELKRRYDKNKTLIIDPDFQRNDVWKPKQKSELIESILIGFPIPIIYLFEDVIGNKQVVDGRQRLSAIFEYLNDKFVLKDLNILKDQNNKKFTNLSPQLQYKIEDYPIETYTIQHPIPEKVKFAIFDRIKRGGTRLNNQEMRNVLYFGRATELLNDLSSSKVFLKATGNGISKKRMKDKYMILRFLGFYLLKTNKLVINNNISIRYKGNINEFLAEIMGFINKQDDVFIIKLIDIFIRSMENCYTVLGSDAFRFYGFKKRPINIGLFEVLAYILSIDLKETVDIEKLKVKLEGFKKEMDDSGKFTGIIDTTPSVDYRFEEANKIRGKLKNG